MRSSRPRLLVLSLLGSVVLPACEEMQDPEPLAKTVPVALLLVALSAGPGLLLLRTVFRKATGHASAHGSAAPLRFPRLTAALVVAPVTLVGVALVLVAAWDVGFAYRRPHLSIWSWESAVELWAVVLGVVAVALAVSSVTALAVLSRHRLERAAGIAILVAAVVGLSFAGGTGLVWLPGLVASLVQRPDALRNSSQIWVRSSSVGGAGSTSSPSTSSKATRLVIVHSVSANASRA